MPADYCSPQRHRDLDALITPLAVFHAIRYVFIRHASYYAECCRCCADADISLLLLMLFSAFALRR